MAQPFSPADGLSPGQIDNLITLNRALVVQHLLRGIAHDLRNNLQVVALGSSLGEESAGTTIALRVERSLDGMVGSLDLLSRLGKAPNGGPAETGLGEAVAAVTELAGLQRSYPTRLAVERPPVDAILAIGRDDFVLVALNLIANAKEAGAGAGDQVIFRARGPVDGRVTIEIDDRGGGIPAGVGIPLRSLGDPSSHGGVGLFVSRVLVERAGGTLRWGPLPDGGSRVTVELPVKAVI